jgi:hypothetical protein
VFHREAGEELLKPAANDLLQKWPVSKRDNSSRASDDEATLTERVELARLPDGVLQLFHVGQAAKLPAPGFIKGLRCRLLERFGKL